jgi:preprotein translocase subunit YajC
MPILAAEGAAAPSPDTVYFPRLDAMLISAAYAQGTGATSFFENQGALIQFLPLVLIFVVFYFLLIRPQQRKAKEQKTMLDALRRGDRVVTGGGIIGTVVRADSPDEVTVEITDSEASGGRGQRGEGSVRVRVVRSTITSVLAKPDPSAAREAVKQREEARAKAGAKD